MHWLLFYFPPSECCGFGLGHTPSALLEIFGSRIHLPENEFRFYFYALDRQKDLQQACLVAMGCAFRFSSTSSLRLWVVCRSRVRCCEGPCWLPPVLHLHLLSTIVELHHTFGKRSPHRCFVYCFLKYIVKINKICLWGRVVVLCVFHGNSNALWGSLLLGGGSHLFKCTFINN